MGAVRVSSLPKVDLRKYKALRENGVPDDEAERIVMDGIWPPPVPFYQAELPSFPTQTLPKWQRDFVEAEAEATQTPPDLAAMQTLCVVAAAIQRKVVVRVREGWTEPVNLFTVVVQESGTRKSRVTKDTTAPVEDWEEREGSYIEPAIHEASNAYRIKETRLQRLQRQAAQADEVRDQRRLADEALDLAWELAELEIPVPPRIIADDTTPEKLQTLIRDHEGRMAVVSPEGDVFDIMSGRYSTTGESNFGVYLKGHAGDTLRVDRVGRPPEYVRNPALTVSLAIQPEVLRGLHSKSGFRGRGLLARFLYSLPPSLVGKRKIDAPPVPRTIRTTYETYVDELLSLPWTTGSEGEKIAHELHFSDGARVRFLEFMKRLEPALARTGELGTIADWGGKLAGTVARIAGLLHVGNQVMASMRWEAPIGQEVVERAIIIGEKYLIPHAKAAFGEMGADPSVDDARYILEIISEKILEGFKKQDMWQLTKGRFKKVEGLNEGLRLLVEHGYLRENVPETEPGRRGRKPAPTYDVNPLLWSYNSYDS